MGEDELAGTRRRALRRCRMLFGAEGAAAARAWEHIGIDIAIWGEMVMMRCESRKDVRKGVGVTFVTIDVVER